MATRVIGVLAACCLAAAACSGAMEVGPDGIRVRMKASDLQQRLDRAAGFPVHRSLQPLGSIEVASARLVLEPGDNALGLSMPVKVRTLGRSWSGQVAFSAAPGYDRDTGTIYLHRFALRQVQGTGLPQEIADLCAGILTQALRDSVKRVDVYTLDRGNSRENAARYLLKDIEVQEDGVAFHLAP